MFFVLLVIVAIVLYVLDYKVPAFVLFFFFLTSGFNLIPEEMMELGMISKGNDYAFFILLGIVAIDSFCLKKYLKVDDFIKYLIVFGIFLLACMIYSKWSVGLGWAEILRTCRFQFFWIAYFAFRSMEKKQLEMIIKILFTIITIISILYLVQIFINESILLKQGKGYLRIGDLKIPRFYNQPDMLQFFTFIAICHNPYKKILKWITTFILVAALLGAFHRSLTGLFFLMLLLGYIVRLSRTRRILLLSLLGFIVMCGISIAGVKMMQSRAYSDLKNLAQMNFADIETDIDIEMLQESTFTFRIALVYERMMYLSEHPVAMILGAGLIPEDSKLADSMFNFQIGLPDELTGNITQIESGDISFSSLFLRTGYIGTALYLMLWIYFAVFFYKNRENNLGLASFIYSILAIFVAFFSGNLLIPVNYLLPLISYVIIQKTNQEQEMQKVIIE